VIQEAMKYFSEARKFAENHVSVEKK
jgi:hypothetical protein